MDSSLGLKPYQGRKLAYALNLKPELVRSVAGLIGDLYKVFEAHDCSLVEINPLVVTADDRVLAVDAKLSIDDDALFRQPESEVLRDPDQEGPPGRSRRKSLTSAMSSWRATSGALSTAPAWPWLPWTS